MALATFPDLKSSVASWLAREDLAGVIPDFITLAEGYLNAEPRLRVRLAEASATLTPSGGVCTLPADYGSVRDVWVDAAPPRRLTLASPDWAREHYAGAASAACPDVYTIVGASLTPYPSSASDIGLIYYRKIAALSESAPSNWLLAAHPEVYLYATLAQAAPFLGDDMRVQTWTAMLEAALGRISAYDVGDRFARPSARLRGPTP